MSRAFASAADLDDKKVTFEPLAKGVYAYTAEGDPNAGVIVGEDSVMVIDALATPFLAQTLLREIRKVTDKPIKYMVMSHYHAVRCLGASTFRPDVVIASTNTRDLIAERGRQDFKSEADRFPRLFKGIETVPGLTWPTVTFDRDMTVWMGKREIRIIHLGKGHTKGDTIVWLPKEKVCFSGDLVEAGATPYCGDAYLTEWPDTLKALKKLGARKLVPGRGPALKSPQKVAEAIDGTRGFVKDMLGHVAKSAKAGKGLKEAFDDSHKRMSRKYADWTIFEHCMPFNVSRAFDEAKGVTDPTIWTAKRDKEMWAALQG